MNFKKLTLILTITLMIIAPNSSKATEECFEGVSRAMFKFNMAFDDVLLEPVAKGYNKLPEFIRKGTNQEL